MEIDIWQGILFGISFKYLSNPMRFQAVRTYVFNYSNLSKLSVFNAFSFYCNYLMQLIALHTHCETVVSECGVAIKRRSLP